MHQQPARAHYFMEVIIRVSLQDLTGLITRVLFVSPLLPPYRPSHMERMETPWDFVDGPYSLEVRRPRRTRLRRMRRRCTRQLGAASSPPLATGGRLTDQSMGIPLRHLRPRHLLVTTMGKLSAPRPSPPLTFKRRLRADQRLWPPAAPHRGAASRANVNVIEVVHMN
jgi:hypothetical protein